MSLQPLSYRNVPCSSFLTDCCNLIHLCCVLSFNLFNLSRFMVSLVCRRSNLVLPLLFLFRFSPVTSQISGRDPLVVVECCNAPRPTLQNTSSYLKFCRVICFVCCIHHCIICIASCHHYQLKCFLINKLYGSSIHLNRGKCTW